MIFKTNLAKLAFAFTDYDSGIQFYVYLIADNVYTLNYWQSLPLLQVSSLISSF